MQASVEADFFDYATKPVRAARAELSKQGFSEVKFKNTWGEVGYKGINAVCQTAEGFKFELQFHTSSF
ncbi:hypothetical protein JMK10_07970 [Rhodovulum sulfidophilum]|uniref:hypothetical protein n=1 Tax=Rhodovulum sulfidophilum TaxID=35806 RepID=UPI00192322A7|nr:hypothetical protein [Rhodovulum sulfidophilum]MBL3576292.1 hypothetical protein [Rhodovulum sulfidophilum]MCE8433755.1 hypothetical protein [Rhodovulum sulfidophilum]MCF4116743.1 hypothetical protein [Rhodovulum sulfidophilum]